MTENSPQVEGPPKKAASVLGSEALKDGPVLLYDGECGVCSQSVQWILAHERTNTLRFAALSSELGQKLIQEAQVPSDIDSLLWVENDAGRVKARKWSSSVIAALQYVGGPWSALALIRFIPAPIRDFGYRLFAKHRTKLAAKVCLLPPPQTRARFLDA